MVITGIEATVSVGVGSITTGVATIASLPPSLSWLAGLTRSPRTASSRVFRIHIILYLILSNARASIHFLVARRGFLFAWKGN
jgi:hypothetical protein